MRQVIQCYAAGECHELAIVEYRFVWVGFSQFHLHGKVFVQLKFGREQREARAGSGEVRVEVEDASGATLKQKKLCNVRGLDQNR